MKVIIASTSKCGTKTLHKCFEILGYSVADFEHHCYNHYNEWKNIFENGSRKEQLYEMYKDFDVVTGSPASFYWEEIAKAFPNAKVILTTRDDESTWYRSISTEMPKTHQPWIVTFCYLLTPTGIRLRHHYDRMLRVAYSMKGWGFFRKYDFSNWEVLIKRYREHNAGVLSRCRKDRLLHFHFREGWEGLCAFLGEEIPDRPFPHENKRGQLATSMWDLPVYVRMKREAYIVMAIVAILIAFVSKIYR